MLPHNAPTNKSTIKVAYFVYILIANWYEKTERQSKYKGVPSKNSIIAGKKTNNQHRIPKYFVNTAYGDQVILARYDEETGGVAIRAGCSVRVAETLAMLAGQEFSRVDQLTDQASQGHVSDPGIVTLPFVRDLLITEPVDVFHLVIPERGVDVTGAGISLTASDCAVTALLNIAKRALSSGGGAAAAF